MTNSVSEEDARLTEIFFGHALERRAKIKREDTHFVVYTSAGTAKKIIENKELWLRNARLMNDFSEIEHGERCLHFAWHSNIGHRLRIALATIDPALPDRVGRYLTNTAALRYASTYLMSFSEHGDAAGKEKQFGRLSMWRAYGGDTNVALVLDRTPFFSESKAYGLAFSPVLYRLPDEFKDHEFREFVEAIEVNLGTLKDVNVEKVENCILGAFHNAVLSIKHPGFSEEREWRLIFTAPENRKSSAVTGRENYDEGLVPQIVELGEGPQTIFRLPIQNVPEKGLVGADLDQALKQIIVGPVRFPATVREALVATLENAKIANPEELVVTSGIPLRR